MKIRHYLYNAFTIEEDGLKLAIDPGQNLYMFNKKSLIPETEWDSITHILVTHGDPDHFAFATPLAKKAGAEVFCGMGLEADFIAEGIMRPHSMIAGETSISNKLKIEGLKVKHGSLPVKMLGGAVYVKGEVRESDRGGQEVYLAGIRIQKIEKPMKVFSHGTVKLLFGLIRLEKDNLDFARGSIGYKISMNGKTIVNLGDSLLMEDWKGLKPDILMLPIGGGKVPNTMDVQAAIEAVDLISPGLVIPCHYNVPYGLSKNINPTDDVYFKNEVEKRGTKCELLNNGDELVI
ncbi:MBL fold metallo-hydrolase [Bacteroidota bacterium]